MSFTSFFTDIKSSVFDAGSKAISETENTPLFPRIVFVPMIFSQIIGTQVAENFYKKSPEFIQILMKDTGPAITEAQKQGNFGPIITLAKKTRDSFNTSFGNFVEPYRASVVNGFENFTNSFAASFTIGNSFLRVPC